MISSLNQQSEPRLCTSATQLLIDEVSEEEVPLDMLSHMQVYSVDHSTQFEGMQRTSERLLVPVVLVSSMDPHHRVEYIRHLLHHLQLVVLVMVLVSDMVVVVEEEVVDIPFHNHKYPVDRSTEVRGIQRTSERLLA